MDRANATNQPVTEFVLLGFSTLSPEIRWLLLTILSTCYAFTLLGNLCIVCLVILDNSLSRMPMYILLGNFSGLEICYVTCSAPRMLTDLASPPGVISFHGCFLQFYFFFSVGVTEAFILAMMALDRYLAICHPLRYPLLMSVRVCCTLAAFCWLFGFLWFLVPIIIMSKLPFCEPNIMDHFVCDPGPLLALLCAPAPHLEASMSILSCFDLFGCFLFIMTSYGSVARAVLKLPRAGRQKAFSTCISHLTTVSIFYGSLMGVYINPASSGGSNKVVTLFYSVVTPLLNPLIYSFRNKEIKAALRRILLPGGI